MPSFSLQASTRSATGKHARALLQQRLIPAVLYGHGVKNVNLELPAGEFAKIFRQAGSSSLVDLSIDGQPPVKVLIHAVQRHPTRSELSHADLYQVKMTEKLQAEIELTFEGESPAVKEQGGILVRALDKLKVECLPADLVASIAIDISRLKTFEDHIRVTDVVVPPGMTILNQPEEMVATVTPPRSDEELAKLSEEVTEDVAGVGTVEKPKAEEEAMAEGEAGATAAAPAEKSEPGKKDK